MNGARCLVLNASFELLHITEEWIDAIKLVTKGKATPLATYDFSARSERSHLPIPAVVVLKQYVHVGRRRQAFSYPSKNNIIVRDGFKCAYCMKPVSMRNVTRDHVMPRSRGGPDTITNVVASCSDCNGRKADRTPQEAGMKLHVQPRHLTDDEKIAALVKTHKSYERAAWIDCLKSHGLTLF